MSEPFSAADVATWCDGTLQQGTPETRFDGVSIDTRTLAGSPLFVAIHGPNHDAHEYLARAESAGASGLLIEGGRPECTSLVGALPIIAVRDTTLALGQLAAGHRRRFSGPVIALTGSCGKTTTKEMIAAILETVGPCLKNRGNLNNEFGLPLTLLRRETKDERVVVELGMNHRGEIARLAEIAKPTIGLVTNVGTAHIEFLGSRDEIAAEKGDLFAALDAEGIAIANWDDLRVRRQSERAAGRVLSYGIDDEADVRAEDIRFDDENYFRFTLVTASGQAEIRVLGLGETTVINALAAAGVGVACGLDNATIARGISRYRGVSGRMSHRLLERDVTLIDDTYNANPQSMEAAIKSLARLRGSGRGLAVLGGMGELGDDSKDAHRDTGRWVCESGIELLVTVGAPARDIADGALTAGMDPGSVHWFESVDQAEEMVRSYLKPRDWVLVKGSRAARMEKFVEILASGERS